MIRRHLTDEQLVAHLDGELGHLIARYVRRHLEACWQCRARLKLLEDQAVRLGDAFARDEFPGPDRLALAIERFENWKQSPPMGQRPSSYVLPFRPNRYAIACACAALLLLALVWLSTPGHPPPSPATTPEVILAQAQAVEMASRQSPLHESYRVELEQTRPDLVRKSARLEVWSDGTTERFSSRWTDSEGILKAAVWRPDGSRTYQYDAGTRKAHLVAPQSKGASQSLLELAASSERAADLEAAFVAWLKAQLWQPVFVSSEMARFASAHGIRLEVVSLAAPGTLRLSARHRSSVMTAEIQLELDVNTYRPRLQRIRLESPERQAEITLVREAYEAIPPARLVRALFEQ